jgi:hypothetical protein
MNKALRYGAGLIALYLVVYNGSKAGTLFRAGAYGTTDVVKALQGR